MSLNIGPPSPMSGKPETGPVEINTKSIPFNGRSIKPEENVQPYMAGKELGKHLDMKGWKLLTMFFRHVKATLHLKTGKLETMRSSNPVQYMEELSDLSTSPKHWHTVIAEGNELKKLHPSLQDQIKGWQIAAFINIAGESSQQRTSTAFLPSLTELSKLADSLKPIPYDGRRGELGKKLNPLFQKAQRILGLNGVIMGSIKTINEAMSRLEEAISPTSGFENPASALKSKANQLIIAANKKQAELKDKAKELILADEKQQGELTVKAERVAVFDKELAIKLTDISEVISQEDVLELQNQIIEDPESEEAWSHFEDISYELDLKQIRTLLQSIQEAHPDSSTVNEYLVYYQNLGRQE